LILKGCVNKNPPDGGFLVLVASSNRRRRLLDLGFLIGNMLADDRIELLHFQLFRRRALVLSRSVEMPGTRSGNQFDLVAHGDRS
jgi:hypothetical protein